MHCRLLRRQIAAAIDATPPLRCLMILRYAAFDTFSPRHLFYFLSPPLRLLLLPAYGAAPLCLIRCFTLRYSLRYAITATRMPRITPSRATIHAIAQAEPLPLHDIAAFAIRYAAYAVCRALRHIVDYDVI